jgi:hypothetical protein
MLVEDHLNRRVDASALDVAMIEDIRTHPYSRAVCLETARLFEQQAATHLINAQYWADRVATDRARELQSNARLAQQRANAWRLRAKYASDCSHASCRLAAKSITTQLAAARPAPSPSPAADGSSVRPGICEAGNRRRLTFGSSCRAVQAT